MAERGDEQIVRLQVTVNDAIVVEILNCQSGLGEVCASHVEWQGAHVFYERCHIAALHVLHHHAEELLGLEGADERHHERIVREGHDVAFGEHLLDLIAQQDVLLFYLLHGEALARVPVSHQVDSTVNQN